MRQFFFAIAALSLATPVIASENVGSGTPVVLHVGQVVRDADMNKLGPVSKVQPDGSVQIIYEQHLITLPASTLSVVDGKAKTSLSRHDLTRM